MGRKKIFLNRIKLVQPSKIENISKKALEIEDEYKKIEELKKIPLVKNALTSVILTFYDPKNYGVFDIHVYDELFKTNSKTRPKDLFANSKHYIRVLRKLRKIANNYNIDVRTVEKALFKKNYTESNKRRS
ncbi:MAG: hypothetical protein QXU74_02450 [Candidatus Aenigmatarchaeota archaeon]